MSFTVLIVLFTGCIAVLYFFIKKMFGNREIQKEKPSDPKGKQASWNTNSVRRRSHIVSQVDQPLHTSKNKNISCTTIPRSVNYHFTRQCNYKCGFCFHTAKTSFVLPLEKAKQGLKMLKDAGLEKINFSGGEPFIYKRGEFVGQLTRYCKRDLGLDSVTIVCNGSLVTEQWFKKYGEFLDIMAVSCDSFNEDTNSQIGRQQAGKGNLKCLQNVRDWCRKYHVAFKINTVVNVYNVDEDMNENIQKLAPIRWKVFQCLLIEGENSGKEALRDAEKFVISDDDFTKFVERHSKLSCLVPESNAKVQ